MIVTTGFGYLIKDEKIVSKYVLPIGSHPLINGYTQVEVANQEALDFIEVYHKPLTPEQSFNVETFQTGLFGIIAQLSDPSLRWDFGALNAFSTNKDFSGMKQYLNDLIAAGAAVQGDYDAVNGVLKNQSVDLDTF